MFSKDYEYDYKLYDNKEDTMDIEYIKENYFFEKLNENHNLDSFECEIDDLTNFLKNDALNQQNMNLNLTHLVICDETIIGYVSILTDAIKLKILKIKKLKIKYVAS